MACNLRPRVSLQESEPVLLKLRGHRHLSSKASHETQGRPERSNKCRDADDSLRVGPRPSEGSIVGRVAVLRLAQS